MCRQALQWLVCWLCHKTSAELDAQTSSGQDQFTVRNNIQVYLAHTLSLAYVKVCIMSHADPLGTLHCHHKYLTTVFTSSQVNSNQECSGELFLTVNVGILYSPQPFVYPSGVWPWDPHHFCPFSGIPACDGEPWVCG